MEFLICTIFVLFTEMEKPFFISITTLLIAILFNAFINLFFEFEQFNIKKNSKKRKSRIKFRRSYGIRPEVLERLKTAP